MAVDPETEQRVWTEFEVFRVVDHTHTAATELLQDVVVRDGLADHAFIFPAARGASILQTSSAPPRFASGMRVNPVRSA